MTVLERELNVKIEEYNNLHQKLSKRPFEIKASASIFDSRNHPQITGLIIQKLKDKERFVCKVQIENENLWVLPIGYNDSCNANFDCEEQGQIFVSVLDNEPISEKLKFNDLVTFQSCDVIEIRNIS